MDGATSVHDDATAAALRLAGAPIEGPTHFSLVDPLAYAVWGETWFERGCVSAHFQTMVVEGEQVQASLGLDGTGVAGLEARKADGAPVLTGSASIVDDGRPTALASRLAVQSAPTSLHILDQLEVGMTLPDPIVSVITMDAANGLRYPFSLRDKLAVITEPCSWYATSDNPWGRPILPFEMISVLAHKDGEGFPVRRPSVGLFLDLEVRLHSGPLFVDQPYDIAHTVVALGESRRTESFWTRTTISVAGGGLHVATVLLHSGVFKDSYPGYPHDAEKEASS